MAKTTRVRTGAVAKIPTKNGDQNTVPSGSVDLTKIAGDVMALLVPTGSRIGYVGTTAPTGWVLASGRTIGNAASGALERAAEDARALYKLLWNSYSNTELPVSSGRGASADADFDAAKTITLPDYRGRVGVGKDNMGGTTASRITSAGSGIVGTTLGAAGGAQTHTLTIPQIPSHTHTVYGVADGGSGQPTPRSRNADEGANVTTSATGGDQAHQNTQPSIIETFILKL